MSQVRYDTFWDDLRVAVGQERESKEIALDPVYRFGDARSVDLAAFVDKYQPPIRPAKARLVEGVVALQHESTGMTFSAEKFPQSVEAALTSGEPVKIPVIESPKRIPDAELEKIKAVVSRFSTKFNAGQISRSSNIRLAAQSIDGLVLMPGDTFSFNDHLGQRTRAKGYKEAGVYVSGRHDIDVGGGICQVSTTLYNSLLMGEVKIDYRSPHSLPVPYVPLGRDAAVSFPNPDLKFTNNFDTPIALSASYSPGVLEFRVLGATKNPREVKFESRLLSSWSNGEKIVHDPSLAFGERKVQDRGGSGRKVQTWKVVYEGGVEVERIDLGTSTYRGGPVIVAMNKNAKKPLAPREEAGTMIPASVPDPADGG